LDKFGKLLGADNIIMAVGMTTLAQPSHLCPLQSAGYPLQIGVSHYPQAVIAAKVRHGRTIGKLKAAGWAARETPQYENNTPQVFSISLSHAGFEVLRTSPQCCEALRFNNKALI
jgi:hypothetical protein